MEEFQSGQMGQTVNLLLYGFDGPNPSSSTKKEKVLGRVLSLFSFLGMDSEARKENAPAARF